MAANKTVETKENISDYLERIKDDKRRKDVSGLIDLIEKHTKIAPRMWGTAIVGFGSYHYKYESGREGDAPLFGLASRANAIVFYLGSFPEKEEMLSKLGKFKQGKGCIYIQNPEDIDTGQLVKIVKSSVKGNDSIK